MNQNAFFDDFILMWLYKKEVAISTLEIENFFGSKDDIQNVNNVISNRTNNTSFIHKGLISYNEVEKTLSITDEGKKHIEYKYKNPRN